MIMRKMDLAYRSAKVLPINECTKYVVISDCHRGTGTVYDNFLKNQNLFFAALEYYYQNGFFYIELGDGEELWENRCREHILEYHSNVYWMFSKYEQKNMMIKIFGNHDMCLKKYFTEAVRMCNECKNIDIVLMHGHQADIWNGSCWRLSRFFVRNVWKPLEQMGVNDPTNAARNFKKADKLERRFIKWAQQKQCILMTGHTHRPRLRKEDFLSEGKNSAYVNTGSCVHPRCITGIEIDGYDMSLIKWNVKTRYDRTLYVDREVLEGPVNIVGRSLTNSNDGTSHCNKLTYN